MRFFTKPKITVISHRNIISKFGNYIPCPMINTKLLFKYWHKGMNIRPVHFGQAQALNV